MAVGDDYKVSLRFREDVAELADEWRRAQPSTFSARHFDVARLLTDVVLPSLERQGRHVELKIVENDVTEPEAWVDLGNNELCIQDWVWQSALRQDERGRLIVAHEIGHLVLHGEQIHAFSRGQEQKLGFLDPSESAECQANWFASALLLPDRVLLQLTKLDDASVATLTLVSDRVVAVRRRELSLDKRYRKYTGDECGNCGSAKISLNGRDLVCTECGASYSC